MNVSKHAPRFQCCRPRTTTALRITLLLAGAALLAVAAAAQPSEQRDSSEPRPLKYLMVALGQDMNRINDGLWHGDFEMVRLGACAIAEHPKVTPEQMAAIKEALGGRFEQFVGFDQQVHQTAVELANAAQREAVGDVLDAYRDLQVGCISCHTAFREEVREKLYGQP